MTKYLIPWLVPPQNRPRWGRLLMGWRWRRLQRQLTQGGDDPVKYL